MPGICRHCLLLEGRLIAFVRGLKGCASCFLGSADLLGGSWVVISRVISRVTVLITHIRGVIAHL